MERMAQKYSTRSRDDSTMWRLSMVVRAYGTACTAAGAAISATTTISATSVKAFDPSLLRVRRCASASAAKSLASQSQRSANGPARASRLRSRVTHSLSSGLFGLEVEPTVVPSVFTSHQLVDSCRVLARGQIENPLATTLEQSLVGCRTTHPTMGLFRAST